MRYKMPLFVFLICSLGLPVLFAQDDEDLQIRPLDIVELVNGNRFEGRILSERTDGIQLEMAGGTATFLRADIARVLHRNPRGQKDSDCTLLVHPFRVSARLHQVLLFSPWFSMLWRKLLHFPVWFLLAERGIRKFSLLYNAFLCCR